MLSSSINSIISRVSVRYRDQQSAGWNPRSDGYLDAFEPFWLLPLPTFFSISLSMRERKLPNATFRPYNERELCLNLLSWWKTRKENWILIFLFRFISDVLHNFSHLHCWYHSQWILMRYRNSEKYPLKADQQEEIPYIYVTMIVIGKRKKPKHEISS